MPAGRQSARHGFTLIELLIVVAVISILTGIIVTAVSHARAKARDQTRLNDLRQMQTALKLYRDTFGTFPNSDLAGPDGWDTPSNGTFLAPLSNNNFLQNLRDPATTRPDGNYRYYRYDTDWAQSYKCSEARPFYVLMVVDLETVQGPHPLSPGWVCPGRNWQAEGEWVAGSYE